MKKVLQIIHKKILVCKKCPLWEGRKNAVPGEGPDNAKIMIVGQAPGREEDKTGRPFVGMAGRFLDYLLNLAMHREDIFLTSLVKCLPPKNRIPRKLEIETCTRLYLKEQIRLVNPKRIMLLGKIAHSFFLHKQDFRKWIKKDRRLYFATYHPAAGMRLPKIRKIMEKDFKNF